MDNRIIDVVKKMIENKEKITNIIYSDNEYFFLYLSKYKWGIRYSNNNYYLYYYSDKGISLDKLSDISDWENYKAFKVYSADSDNINLKKVFRELYSIVKDKFLGIDKAFEDILGS